MLRTVHVLDHGTIVISSLGRYRDIFAAREEEVDGSCQNDGKTDKKSGHFVG